MKKDDQVRGLILAGGRSTRMKQDKGLIEYYGIPQRDYLLNLLSPFTTQVHLSCKSDQDVPEHLNPIHDIHDLNTPLNGILSAFHFDPESVWLTVPVDMPLITTEAIRFLLDQRRAPYLATCFLDSTGSQPEPLFTVWEKDSYPFLHEYFQRGGASPREFLKRDEVLKINAYDTSILLNVNDDQMMEMCRKMIADNS